MTPIRPLIGRAALLITSTTSAAVNTICFVAIVGSTALADDRIRPYEQNPYYWQYHGEPVMLLGGSVDDNLFQIPELEKHLDEIAAAGGNYIRNTMSDRRDNGNETSGEEAWATYWAEYLRQQSEEAGVEINITQMWDNWDLQGEQHQRTIEHPERYDFIDVSQNNHNKAQEHWDNFQWVRSTIASKPRPINTIKTYGADGNKFGHTSQDGVERFLRHVVGGAASARFHRPDAGLGLSDVAKAAIGAVRKVESHVRFWDIEPANRLLVDRQENAAYLASDPGTAYVLYLPRGGNVTIDLSDAAGPLELRWINADTGKWGPAESKKVPADKAASLKSPGDGNWLAVLLAE